MPVLKTTGTQVRKDLLWGTLMLISPVSNSVTRPPPLCVVPHHTDPRGEGVSILEVSFSNHSDTYPPLPNNKTLSIAGASQLLQSRCSSVVSVRSPPL